jgi:hypothetical protein
MSRFSIIRCCQALARQSLICRRRPVLARRPTFGVPGLECLEARVVPSTLTVTNEGDPAALTQGTLRYEVGQANADAALGVSDTIVFNTAKMGTNTITLMASASHQGQLNLTGGSGKETIDGGGVVTISGNNASRVFDIAPGTTATLDRLTIANGSA